MLLIQDIKSNFDEVKSRLNKRGLDYSELLHAAVAADDERKQRISVFENNKSALNKLSKEVGMAKGSGDEALAQKLIASVGTAKETLEQSKLAMNQSIEKLQELLLEIPNNPHESVPAGKSEADNQIMSEYGTFPELDQKLPHWELAEKYDLIDFELGVKLTGAGFPVYKGKGSRLQRALINWFLDQAREEGFQEVQVPILVNEASGFGTGQLPDKEGQMYHAPTDNLYLIPTAEVPITNIFRDVRLKQDDFPIKLCGYTPCFRREAGSYGKDVRGLNRLHQFDKVEIVQLSHPKESYAKLEEMQQYVQGLLQKLELPYRVLLLCGGDTGFASAMTYDMEVWSAAQERWLEVSSVSNFESFQANRLNLRFKNEEGKNQYAHTLNGSALALPRIVASILENNQSQDGIRIPEVLVPYTGFSMIN